MLTLFERFHRRPSGYRLLLAAVLICNAAAYVKKIPVVQIITLVKADPCTEVAEEGDEVHVHYSGYLASGSEFDSTRAEGRGPLIFVLGRNQVLQGWDRGIMGMCLGEERKLIIPPELAYGRAGYVPVIPPYATLTFLTEMIKIKKKHKPGIVFKVVDAILGPVLLIGIVYLLYRCCCRRKKKTIAEIIEKKNAKKEH